MGSRTWIKIYCDKWISGTIREETSALRGVWADVLALAGNLNYGDIGQISLPNNIPLTDEQIANIFKIPIREWRQSKSRLLATERIIVNNGIINVANWEKYQSEYFRQKSYRTKLQPKITSQSDTEKENEKEKEKENRKEKNKEITKKPVPSAVDLSTSSQQDKKTVEKFISEGTTFGTGRTDDKFRDEVKEVCLSLARRCSDWGEPVQDEDKFVDKFFGLVSNLMRFGLAKKPEKVTDFKGNPTSKTKMKKLISRMSKPRNLMAELIDAVKKQPKYLP